MACRSSWLLPLTIILGFCSSGLEAILCRSTRSFGLFDETIEYHYCPYSCCGPYHYQYCCGTRVGLIAGTVVGGAGLVIVIIIVLCCYRRRRHANSRFVTNSAVPPVVYHTSTTMNGYPTTTTTIQYPVSQFGPPPTYDQVTGVAPEAAGSYDNHGFKH